MYILILQGAFGGEITCIKDIPDIQSVFDILNKMDTPENYAYMLQNNSILTDKNMLIPYQDFMDNYL